MRPFPSRVRIGLAIDLTRRDRSSALIPDSISIDASYMLIAFVNKRRQNREEKKIEFDLKELVRDTTELFQFDPARRRAYELVAMRYYSLTSQLLARALRRRKAVSIHTTNRKYHKLPQNTS
jgi:hypothetical protein